MKKILLIALAVSAAVTCFSCGHIVDENSTAPTKPIETSIVTSASTAASSESTAATETTVTTTAAPETEASTSSKAESEVNNNTPDVQQPVQQPVPEQQETPQAQPAENNDTPQQGEAEAVGGAPQNTSSGSTAPTPNDYNYGPAPVQYDRSDLTYIQGVLVANKSYSLPSDFNPGIDANCSAQFDKLVQAAANEGRWLVMNNAFRSYDYQAMLYDNYVNGYGQAEADRFSARPGHSEHQSGLAIDVNSPDASFDGTPEAQWLEEHCYEYGFILRYPKGKESITGYKYESWHIRYVGTDMSYKLHDSGLTLEEYFGIDSYYH